MRMALFTMASSTIRGSGKVKALPDVRREAGSMRENGLEISSTVRGHAVTEGLGGTRVSGTRANVMGSDAGPERVENGDLCSLWSILMQYVGIMVSGSRE